MPDVESIVGAGAIGTAVAWRCAQRGLPVTVARPRPDARRVEHGRRDARRRSPNCTTPRRRCCRSSWLAGPLPGFVRRARRRHRRCRRLRASTGTLAVAWDAADLAALRDLHAFGTVARASTPRCSPAASCAASNRRSPPGCPAACSPRTTTRSTRGCCTRRCSTRGPPARRRVRAPAGRRRRSAATARAACASTTDGRSRAGTSWSPHGAWSGGRRPARGAGAPVKGQTLRLRLPAQPAASTSCGPRSRARRATSCRAPTASSWSARPPRRPASTSRPRAGAVYELLRDAQTVLPELGEAVLEEVSTGLRPGSPDNAPIIGPAATACW